MLLKTSERASLHRRGRTSVVEERAQPIERLFGAWVENPAAGSYRANASLVRFGKQRRGAGGQVGDFIVHVHSSSIRILNKGYRFAGVDTAERAPFPIVHLRF
jgi:hypothetical protein